jgi:GTPase
MNKHFSGFVNIIGQPNVGKSTLMNALVGERLAIINNKPQTTRHRIIGIVSGEDYQMVFSDTPGYIDQPAYKMQTKMNAFVRESFEDADIILWVIDVEDKNSHIPDPKIMDMLKKLEQSCPVFLLLNKMDTISSEKMQELRTQWAEVHPFTQILEISALNKTNTEKLFELLRENLPEGAEYYPKDQLTDRPERFFVAEMVREQILALYHQEIPYCCEVLVHSFKEDPNPERNLVRISAYIFVSRDTQKQIVIGKAGSAIKKLGIESRKTIEKFLEKQVHLELVVKVRENWRDNELLLKQFGYDA